MASAVAADAGIGRAAGVVGARIVRVALDHVRERGDVDRARALRVLFHHRDALGGAAARGAAGGKAEGDEGAGSRGRNGESMGRTPSSPAYLLDVPEEAALWRKILNSRETRHQKGAAAQEA